MRYRQWLERHKTAFTLIPEEDGLLFGKMRRRPVPTRPRKRCTYPGCAKLLPGDGTSRCKAHTVKDTRPNAAERGYGTGWQKIRLIQLQDFPLCDDCAKDNGRITPAAEVHHRFSLRKGGSHSPANLASLCKLCHSRRTARGE